MNAPSRPTQPPPKVTHTFFPSPRPAPATVAPPAARPGPDDRKDEEHAPEEPGYGHGV